MLSACLMQGVANRDVKLENTLLVSSARPLIKLCDFGYSKVRGILPKLLDARKTCIEDDFVGSCLSKSCSLDVPTSIDV